VYNLGAVLDCLNPPCQIGGSIVVNGITVELAPDIQVQGVGDNRILRRVTQPTMFYSVYAIPADFIASGATPSSLYDSWTTRLNAEYAAANPPATAAPVGGVSSAGFTLAGLGSNPLLIAVGLGLVAAFLLRRRKGRR
jgi:hypothetical protein